jgi:hypothetical protein
MQLRIIIRHVLSGHMNAVIVALKIAAAHHAFRDFVQLATAFDAIASVGRQSSNLAC